MARRPTDPNAYRPTTRRQRLVIVAVTVATVVALWMLLLLRPGAHVRVFPPSAAERPCPPGQLKGCVGGQLDTVLLPPDPAQGASDATSAPARAAPPR
jgi:hypothetical protein